MTKSTLTEFAQDRRLTCNRIFRHLMFYSQQGFSGRLDVSAANNGSGWSIYMNEGKVIWATGGLHPRRRWQRQVRLATGKTPGSFSLCNRNTKPFWDYLELQQLARHTLSLDQVGAIIQGTLTEILFDIVQAFELPLAKFATSHNRPILPLSRLVGVGDGMQVIPVRNVDLKKYYSSPAWVPSAWLLQKETQTAWEHWVCLGLQDTYPDSAPVINDSEQLRRQVSNKAFHDLTTLLDGNRTFRDIALQCKDQLGAGSALAPYIHKGLIGFHAVGDMVERMHASESTTDIPIIVCFDTTRRNHGLLEHLAAKAECSYEAMIDDIEALYELSRPDFPTPALILVADRLTTLSAEGTCRILRRIDRLRSVPIVAYSEESCSTQQIRQTLSAGATEYLCGEEFNSEGLLALFQQHVGTRRASANERLSLAQNSNKKGSFMIRNLTKQLTLEGFLDLLETEPECESTDEDLDRTPVPQGKHSILLRELSFFLKLAFRPEQNAQAFPDLYCTFGDRSIVPDIAVFRAERIPRERNGNIANTFDIHPDWVIEILTPNQSQTKVIRNMLHCLDNGTAMGWLLDPEESCVFVCDDNKSVRVFDRRESLLPMPEFAKGIRLTAGELFDWMQV